MDHEAGHAVVAHTLGSRLLGLDVWEVGDGYRGLCRAIDQDEDAAVAIELAGLQAESLYLGRNKPSHRNDIQALYWEAHGPHDEALRTAAATVAWLGRERVRAPRQRARAILSDNWPTVQAVAEATLATLDLHLSAEDLNVLLAGDRQAV